MSKKNKQNQQSSSKQDIIDLASLAIAKSITIRLPPSLSIQKINQALMHSYLRAKIIGKRITIGQSFIALYLGKERQFMIVSVGNQQQERQKSLQRGAQEMKIETKSSPSSYVVNGDTSIVLVKQQDQVKKSDSSVQSSFYGFSSELQNLKTTIQHTLYHRKELIENGLGPLKGILISGFSGAGKSAILHEVKRIISQQNKKVYWKQISSVQLLSRVVGGAEQFIRQTFAQLKQKQPAVLSIQDIHLLFGAKETSSNETTLAALLGELDKIVWESVVVIATYNTERDLSKSIKSSGKFQKEITISLPNHFTRLQILQGLFSRLDLSNECDIQGLKKVNLRLNGFSVGEIKQILRQSYTIWGKQLTVHKFEDILKRFKPTEIKELIVQVPQVYWNHIGGYQSVKKQIKKVVELPLTHADKFARFGIEPSKGILLYGPPGCSKTMMAKAIATESKLNFISIKGPQLFSKYVGESQRAIRNIFKRARACSPCVIFFDQIDAIATQRFGSTQVTDRVLCQLLNEMDGIQGLKEVAIVAATNRPQILDKALMRPGRFDYLIYVGPPQESARRDIFEIYLSKSVRSEDVKKLSQLMAYKTQDYTGAEISLVCREAVMLALQSNLECDFIEVQHLQGALKKVRKRLTKQMVVKYQLFCNSLRD